MQVRWSVAFLIVLLSVSLPSRSADAATVRVPADYPKLQDAIDAAAGGDLVLVAAGTYAGPSNRSLSFKGKPITLRSEAGAESTILDCGGEGPAVEFTAAEGAGSVLSGLTIQNGIGENGGGIRVVGGSPTIEGCRFTGNHAAIFGGGLYCEDASPLVVDCHFEGNVAISGGGINCQRGAAPVIRGCTFRANAASYGGGLYADASAPVVEDCLIEGNSVLAGGGIFMVGGASGRVLRSILRGNYARTNGGGLCILQDSFPTLLNCEILGNSADVGGGLSAETATDRPILTHCTIAGNEARLKSGGINCSDGAVPKLRNCILWGNAPESACADVDYTLTGDTDPFFLMAGEYDFARFDTVTLGGKEWKMPRFIVMQGDYRLSGDSPAVDTGNPDIAPPGDIDGLPRPCGPGVDLGAHERCIVVDPPPFVRGDSNGDGFYDLTDAVFTLNFLFLAGAEPECMESVDTDDSGALDITDALYSLIYLFNFGSEIRPPPPPFPLCGPDPTPDDLACDAFFCRS